ncbi:MAG: hypothetical protein N3A59_03350 [Thermodesulfovibrionales bacterium]|nr:hypothetical protein [Thermodesulfovibrionales bacterium]
MIIYLKQILLLIIHLELKNSQDYKKIMAINSINNPLKAILSIFFKTTILVSIAVIILIILPERLSYNLIVEDGPIETLQVILYLVCAALCAFLKKFKNWKDGLSTSFIFLTLALRELDFHVKFTDISITRTKFYFSHQIPFFSKMIGLMIVLTIILVIVLFIKKNLIKFLQNIKNNKKSSIIAFTGLLYIIFANVVDSSLTILTIIGFKNTIRFELEKTFFEEIVELAIPILFIHAIVRYIKENRNGRKQIS